MSRPASEHSSGPVSFEGVTLKSVLEKAGVTFGESIKGKRLSSSLLVEAADGYRVVIALPELDPAFTDKQTLLVFLRDGKPLGEKEGPYRSVIPDEKRSRIHFADASRPSDFLLQFCGGPYLLRQLTRSTLSRGFARRTAQQ